MSSLLDFEAYFKRCPLIAILRGVRPCEVEHIGEALVRAGFTLIEIPLNSPDPLNSIKRLASCLSGRAMVGAGTVLDVEAVAAVHQAGGELIVSPNTNADVIRATVAAGLASLPGFSTPTEAFTALAAGATVLKLFPADVASPSVLKALLPVLPVKTRILPVGGIDAGAMLNWLAAGASGFGIGSSIYSPGRSDADVGERADLFVSTLETCKQ